MLCFLVALAIPTPSLKTSFLGSLQASGLKSLFQRGFRLLLSGTQAHHLVSHCEVNSQQGGFSDGSYDAENQGPREPVYGGFPCASSKPGPGSAARQCSPLPPPRLGAHLRLTQGPQLTTEALRIRVVNFGNLKGRPPFETLKT